MIIDRIPPHDNPPLEHYDDCQCSDCVPSDEETRNPVYQNLDRSESACQYFDDQDRYWEEHTDSLSDVIERIREQCEAHD